MSSPVTPLPETPVSKAIENLANAVAAAAKPREEKSEWTRLEIMKLVISTITPLMILFLGIYVTNSERHAEALTTARIKSYDTIKDDLNRIDCFVNDVGTWKDETPDKVIGYRRAIEREMYEEKGIWSKKTFDAFIEYMDHAAFHIYGGIGKDAQIRTTSDQKHSITGWNTEWDSQLTQEIDPNYKNAHDVLYESFIYDITH